MIREDLYKSIIETILNEYKDVFDNYPDVKNEYEIDGLTESFYSHITNENIKRLMKSMNKFKDGEGKDADIKYVVKRGTFDKETQKRDFTFSSDDLTVVNCDSFFKEEEDYDDPIMIAIEKICQDEQKRKDFINDLKNGKDSGYYVIYNESKYLGIDNLWRLYLYGLCQYINSGKNIPINKDLGIENNPYNLNMSYEKDSKYEQYADIYDVMNELNHSNNVLTSFIKMYQILEYLIYRYELVKIVNGSTIKQSFVRQVKGLDKRYLNGERSAFTNNLFKILRSFKDDISNSEITTDIIEYCAKYYERTSKGKSYLTPEICSDKKQLNEGIAKFIYDTRCAIVHNKETEFHITYLNYNEYACIVPLMKKIIDEIKKRIIELINASKSKIEFENPYMNLY